MKSPFYFAPFAAFFARTFALAAAAFLARAVRSAGVMDAAAALPPRAPPFLPTSRKYSSAAFGGFFAFMSIAYPRLVKFLLASLPPVS